MRQLGSKLLAGGLSAGVVLLWWPMFFPTDSATTWLARGIVWTLCFELLLVAFSPFELALWSTGRGERISRRMEAKRALLDHESPRRRIGRRAVLALGALALPLALIAVGAGSHMAGGHAAVAAPPKVMRVTRVVRVVKPVRVQRVVKIQTVAEQVPTAAPQQYRAPVASLSKPVRKKASTPKRQSAPKTHTPRAHTNVPTQQTAPTTTAPTPTPTPTTQNQSSLPSADQSGAAASPAT